MTISRDSPVPAYQQIADDLRSAISSGQYQIGQRLPAERRLAEHYSVAVMTIRRALDVLQTEGLVVPHEKRGHFVARTPSTQANDTHSPAYGEVMAALYTLQEELHKANFRLDRLEEIIRDFHPDPI